MKANIPETKNERIVIIGGGFAGLKLAQELVNSNFQIVMVDKNNYHQFQPLFYQVATAGLEPSMIAFPFRKIFQKAKNFHFRMARVESIDTNKKCINTSVGYINYHKLVIAAGAENNFFGMDNIEKYAIPMKSISEALFLRNTIFQRFEDALTSSNPETQQQYMNIIVVGGGPTGVEIAGTLAEMKKHILPKDYPEMDFSKMRIILVEASPNVLSAMSPISSQKAAQYLQQLGVELILNNYVTDYDGTHITFKNHEPIAGKTLVWAAGIKGAHLPGLPENSKGAANRIKTNNSSLVEGTQDVFAIGDIALMSVNNEFPMGHPQMAQVAMQMAQNLANNFKSEFYYNN